MSKSLIRGTAVGTVSALALAIAGQAAAVSFDAGNTKVSIGGYVKGDLIYDANQDLGDTFASRSITTGAAADSQPEGYFRAHARQTRLTISTATPTDDGKTIKTLIQGDFFGDGGNEAVSNSRSFRIRHAFASYDGIGVGQTWSNFMPLVALPPSLDFAGPSGYSFMRQDQLRFTSKTENGSFAVALENAEARISGTTDDKDSLPDVTVNYTGKSGNLKYTASGVVSFLEVDDGGANDDSATGFGAMLAASTTTDSGTRVGGNIGYFDGANRYLWQGGGGGFNNAFYSGGEIETAGELALMGFVDVPVGEKTKMMVAVGHSKLDDEAAAVAAGAAEKFTSVHANVRYTPVKNVTLGAEVIYAEKEMFNGDDGDATRLMFSGQFSF